MNTKQKSDEPSFNITLSEFLDSHLRTDFCCPVSHRLGEILEVISKDKCICHVQWLDFDGKKLSSPVLWRYKYWIESSERNAIAKQKSEQERIRRFIFNKNLEILTEACQATMQLDDKWARDTALSILLKNKTKMLQVLEVELITNIEDV